MVVSFFHSCPSLLVIAKIFLREKKYFPHKKQNENLEKTTLWQDSNFFSDFKFSFYQFLN